MRGEDGKGPEGGRGGAWCRVSFSPHSCSPNFPQGWTDTEAAAAWGAAQQMNGWSLCGQDLDDEEAKSPPSPQGREAETSRKVIGYSTCQSVKMWEIGASSPENGLEGTYSCG